MIQARARIYVIPSCLYAYVVIGMQLYALVGWGRVFSYSHGVECGTVMPVSLKFFSS